MSAASPELSRPLRVGIINLMPRAQTYEPSLLGLLASSGAQVVPVWLRLETHAYSSTDPAHLAEHYVPYARALGMTSLDALIVTGAPVEHLPLSQVRYWPELREILGDARRVTHGVLGICWGALALGELAGLEKTLHARKVFGVFEHAVRGGGGSEFGLGGTSMVCPHSRFAGFSRDEVLRAERAGDVRLVAEAAGAGPAIVTAAGGAVVMHLGHPEYAPARVAYEWERDREAGRDDVDPPNGVTASGQMPSWEADSAAFARAWARGVCARRARA